MLAMKPASTETNASSRLRRMGHGAVRLMAGLFALQILFVIIGPPQFLVDWLRGVNEPMRGNPAYVVVLGGGGIPSDTSLLRCYYAADYGRSLTGTVFVVALPADENPEQNSVGRMRDEIVMRGIPSATIRMETRGRQTHEQAVNIRALLGDEALGQALVIVTSGFHMRRSILSFRKAGFTAVYALTASNVGAEADPGAFAWLRYGIWKHWALEAEICRELVALTTYKLRGWI
jgi:uncharacterized SAM-binding protein YcdF (DUF218 family)